MNSLHAGCGNSSRWGSGESRRSGSTLVTASLETPRLRLRRLVPADEPDLIALDTDPDVMRYVGSPAGVKSPSETAERARRRVHERGAADGAGLGFWRVEGRDDAAFYGLGALIRMPEGDDVEVAYRLARAAWGRGVATEAAGALVGYAFDTLRLRRVVAVTYPDNVASQRVLDKLGFERRGVADYNGVQTTFHVLTESVWRSRSDYTSTR
jgi:[ribosomal protein S5]-alanine N-acetyltransferase